MEETSGQWDSSWEALIDRVIYRVGLAKLLGSRDDARQFLRLAIVEHQMDRFRELPEAFRYTILHRRALDAWRQLHVPYDREESAIRYVGNASVWPEEVIFIEQEPEPTPEQLVSQRQLLARLEEIATRDIPPRNLTILKQFLAGLTQREIADEHGVSRTRVQQIVEDSIDVLKKKSS